MALDNLGVGILFKAKDLASGTIKGLRKNFDTFDESVGRSRNGLGRFTKEVDLLKPALKSMATGLAIATVGFAGLTAGFNLAAKSGAFTQGLAAIGAVTNATEKELALLRDTAIEAGVATQFSPEEAVAGLLSLATAGQTATQATRTLTSVLDLAAGSLGQLGVAGAAEAVVGTLNAYGKSADEAADVTDKLLKITQLTNFQTRDFGVGLAKAAAAGAQFGQSLEDTLITVGLMRNANIDASSASTAFREATRRLGSDIGAQKAILKAGVSAFDAQTGAMRPLIDIMQDLVARTQSLTDQERNRIVVQAFGARGMLAFNAIAKAQKTITQDGVKTTLRGAAAIAFFRREMGAATGTAKKFRDQILDTFEGQKTLLRGTMAVIATVIGEPFERLLKPVVGAIVEGLNFVLKLFLALPDSVKNAFAAFFLGVSAALVLVGIKIAIGGLIVVIKLAIPFIIAMLLPFIKIIAVVALLIAAAFLLKKAWDTNFGGIRDFTIEVFGVIKDIVSAFREDFKATIDEAFGGAEFSLEEFKFAFMILFDFIKVLVKSTLTIIKPVFILLAQVFGGAITALIGVLTGNIDLVIRGVTRSINGAVSFINKLVDAVVKVGFALGLTDAQLIKLSGAKLEAFTPAEVAFAFGASDETVARIAAGPAQTAPGGFGGGLAGAPSGAAPSATTASPLDTKDGFTARDLAFAFEEAVRAGKITESSRPILVESLIEMDGRELAKATAQQDREGNARNGGFAPIFGE